MLQYPTVPIQVYGNRENDRILHYPVVLRLYVLHANVSIEIKDQISIRVV